MVASLRVRRTAHQGTLRRLEEIPGFSPREVVMVLDVEDHVLGHAGQPVELSNNLRPYEQTQQTEDGDHRCWQCRPRRSGYGVGAASNKMLWKTDTRSPAQVHRNRISEKRRGKTLTRAEAVIYVTHVYPPTPRPRRSRRGSPYHDRASAAQESCNSRASPESRSGRTTRSAPKLSDG